MKKSFIIAAALLAVMVSCQKEQLQETDGCGKFSIRATREAAVDTKATITDDGVFGWSVGDAFGLYANGTFYDFATENSGESVVFEGHYLGTLGNYAVFPNNLTPSVGVNDGAVSVTLPDTYAWEEGKINTPMLASFDASNGLPSSITFNHLGGLIRVTLNNIPAEATSFVFSTTNNMPITGTFTAEKESDEDASKMQISSVETSGTTANSVKFTFDASTTGTTNKSFYVPVPVGKYKMNLALYKENSKIWSFDGSNEHDVTRAKFIRTTPITIASTTAGGEDSAVSVEVAGNFNGTYYLPNTEKNVYVIMNSTDGEVTIEYANTTDAKKPENVYINCGGNTIKTLNVNLSESHVEVSGNEAQHATIGTFKSKTNSTTLVLKKTVDIGGTLTVSEGSVEIAGTVNAVNVENTVGGDATVKVATDATVTKLDVAQAKSVEIAGTVEAVAIKTDVSSVTIAGSVKNVEVSKEGSSTTTEKTVIWVTETGSITEALTDKTNSGTDASGSSISIVAASSEAGSGAGQIKEVKNSSASTVSGAVQTPSTYLTSQLENGGTVTLEEDIKGYFTIKSDKTAIINLNGKNISTPSSGEASPIFTVESGATLTIKGEGNVTNTASGKPAIVNNGTLNIKGGTYSAAEGQNLIENSGKLSISDGAFSAPISNQSGSVSITGGIYKTSPDESFLAEGYYFFANNDEETKTNYPWRVNGVVMLGDDTGYYPTLNAAISAAGSTETTITLLRDIKISSPVYVNSGQKIVFNANKKTINPLYSGYYQAITVNGGELIITGGGKFCATNKTGDGRAILHLYNGKLTVNDAYLEGANTCIVVVNGVAEINDATVKALDGGACITAHNSGVVNVRGLKFTCEGDDPDGPGSCWAMDGGTINIYDGVFNAALLSNKTQEQEVVGANYCLYDYYDVDGAEYEGTTYHRGYINVYGGTFKEFNPADNACGHSLVADGYQSVYDETTGSWVVSKKN